MNLKAALLKYCKPARLRGGRSLAGNISVAFCLIDSLLPTIVYFFPYSPFLPMKDRAGPCGSYRVFFLAAYYSFGICSQFYTRVWLYYHLIACVFYYGSVLQPAEVCEACGLDTNFGSIFITVSSRRCRPRILFSSDVIFLLLTIRIEFISVKMKNLFVKIIASTLGGWFYWYCCINSWSAFHSRIDLTKEKDIPSQPQKFGDNLEVTIIGRNVKGKFPSKFATN